MNNNNSLLFSQAVSYPTLALFSSFPTYHQSPLQNENLLALLSYQQQCYNNQLRNLQLHRQLSQANALSNHKALLQETHSATNLSTPTTRGDFDQGDMVLLQKQKGDFCANFLRPQVAKMVAYFVNCFGKATSQDVSSERNKYASNRGLLELFDALAEKYSKSGKCKEDMIRFVLRKAISSLRNTLKKKHNLSSKAASMMLCKKYFKIESEEILNQIDIENEEEILSFLLPYKKNSRNKTANTCFITEIFASEVFRNDYTNYLQSFDSLLEDDNKKKVDRLIEFLTDCVKNNTISKVHKYKRLPWLKSWLDATKVLAYELLKTTPKPNHNEMKKIKK